ncbi:MAG: thioredoxin [Holosporales bacterium]
MSVHHASDATFDQEVLKASGLVLVDFWAEWCGPCRAISPILDMISESLPQVKIVKVNIDENPATPSQYSVRSIPTLMLFKNGQLVATKVAALPKNLLEEWIQSHI